MQQNEVRTLAQNLVEDVRIATADLHTGPHIRLFSADVG